MAEEILDGNVSLELWEDGSVVFLLRAEGYKSKKVRIPKQAAAAMRLFFSGGEE